MPRPFFIQPLNNPEQVRVPLQIARQTGGLQVALPARCRQHQRLNMWTHEKLIATGSLPLLAAWLLTGCTTAKTTTTTRSATEQLLLSTATDHALQATSLDMFAGRKVFLDATYFESYDAKYAVGAMRDALSRAGALLTDTATNSDLIIEARSGALAVDQLDTFVGVPGVTLPIPLSGPVKTPDVPFYKSEKQLAFAKFALLVHGRQSTALIYSSGPVDGKAYDNWFQMFFISWHRTDVSEKQITREQTRKYQTWFPQYGPGASTQMNTNLPAK